MTRRAALFVASSAVVIAVVAAVGAAGAWPLRASHETSSATSNLNTTSQKTFGNSGNLVDVTDNPVSLPSEKVIYPPRTGNAGFATPPREATSVVAVLLLGTASLIAGSRMLTAPRPRS